MVTIFKIKRPFQLHYFEIVKLLVQLKRNSNKLKACNFLVNFCPSLDICDCEKQLSGEWTVKCATHSPLRSSRHDKKISPNVGAS